MEQFLKSSRKKKINFYRPDRFRIMPMKQMAKNFGWIMVVFGTLMMLLSITLTLTDEENKVRISPFYYIFIILILGTGAISLYFSKRLE